MNAVLSEHRRLNSIPECGEMQPDHVLRLSNLTVGVSIVMTEYFLILINGHLDRYRSN